MKLLLFEIPNVRGEKTEHFLADEEGDGGGIDPTANNSLNEEFSVSKP